jgi:dynein heavy chain 1
LLLGEAGSGKTMLTKFVAWMRGLEVFELKVSKKYGLEDFDKDLRNILIRAGTSREKVCFLADGNDVSNSAFLERMNSLLASGEIPGLFEGEDYQKLLATARRAISGAGENAESEEEVYSWFVQQVKWNLHVVFMLNSTGGSFHADAAASPALFNRCVVNWFGNWEREALIHVGLQYLEDTDLGLQGQPESVSDLPDSNVASILSSVIEKRQDLVSSESTEKESILWEDIITTALILIHESSRSEVARLQDSSKGIRRELCTVTPRQYIDFVKYFFSLVARLRERYGQLESHVSRGLETNRLKRALRKCSENYQENQKS